MRELSSLSTFFTVDGVIFVWTFQIYRHNQTFNPA